MASDVIESDAREYDRPRMIVLMWNRGMTSEEIGAQLGLPGWDVRKKLAKLRERGVTLRDGGNGDRKLMPNMSQSLPALPISPQPVEVVRREGDAYVTTSYPSVEAYLTGVPGVERRSLGLRPLAPVAGVRPARGADGRRLGYLDVIPPRGDGFVELLPRLAAKLPASAADMLGERAC